jgi:hypothetical protein
MSEKMEMYTIYRSYIEHEDELINNRMTWFIQLHSFILATYAISASSIVSVFIEKGTDCTSDEIRNIANLSLITILVGITIVGIISSHFSAKSIDAAENAIKNLSNEWNNIKSENLDQYKDCPGITGGGSRHASDEGMRLHIGMPRTMLYFWIASFVVPGFLLYLVLNNG